MNNPISNKMNNPIKHLLSNEEYKEFIETSERPSYIQNIFFKVHIKDPSNINSRKSIIDTKLRFSVPIYYFMNVVVKKNIDGEDETLSSFMRKGRIHKNFSELLKKYIYKSFLDLRHKKLYSFFIDHCLDQDYSTPCFNDLVTNELLTEKELNQMIDYIQECKEKEINIVGEMKNFPILSDFREFFIDVSNKVFYSFSFYSRDSSYCKLYKQRFGLTTLDFEENLDFRLQVLYICRLIYYKMKSKLGTIDDYQELVNNEIRRRVFEDFTKKHLKKITLLLNSLTLKKRSFDNKFKNSGRRKNRRRYQYEFLHGENINFEGNDFSINLEYLPSSLKDLTKLKRNLLWEFFGFLHNKSNTKFFRSYSLNCLLSKNVSSHIKEQGELENSFILIDLISDSWTDIVSYYRSYLETMFQKEEDFIKFERKFNL